MTRYAQTNEQGYVVSIIEEPLLIGLFGGTKTATISDEQAKTVEQLLKDCHSKGEGLHLDDLVRLKLVKE